MRISASSETEGGEALKVADKKRLTFWLADPADPAASVTVVFVEQSFIVIAGMGLGTIVGLQIGRLMMDFLGTDERGENVLPPFLLAVSWPEIFVVWGILGAVFVVTIAAVVLLYLRLAVHRALRIGDA